MLFLCDKNYQAIHNFYLENKQVHLQLSVMYICIYIQRWVTGKITCYQFNHKLNDHEKRSRCSTLLQVERENLGPTVVALTKFDAINGGATILPYSSRYIYVIFNFLNSLFLSLAISMTLINWHLFKVKSCRVETVMYEFLVHLDCIKIIFLLKNKKFGIFI